MIDSGPENAVFAQVFGEVSLFLLVSFMQFLVKKSSAPIRLDNFIRFIGNLRMKRVFSLVLFAFLRVL